MAVPKSVDMAACEIVIHITYRQLDLECGLELSGKQPPNGTRLCSSAAQ
jgi:hypothetical protein